MLDGCGMSELPDTGNSFTWGGRRETIWIQSKLDRAFGNKEWLNQFPASNQVFLAKRGSYHQPVLIRPISSQDSYRGSFKFDRRMFHKPLVKEDIDQAWNSSVSSQFSVSPRIRKCKKSLSQWKKGELSGNDNKIVR